MKLRRCSSLRRLKPLSSLHQFISPTRLTDNTTLPCNPHSPSPSILASTASHLYIHKRITGGSFGKVFEVKQREDEWSSCGNTNSFALKVASDSEPLSDSLIDTRRHRNLFAIQIDLNIIKEMLIVENLQHAHVLPVLDILAVPAACTVPIKAPEPPKSSKSPKIAQSTLQNGDARKARKRFSIGLLMNLMKGGTLADLIFENKNARETGKPANHRLTCKRKLKYLCHISSGMSYLHSNNILHRDLSSQNCLIDKSDDRVVLADFGLSKVFRSYSACTDSDCCACADRTTPPPLPPHHQLDSDYSLERESDVQDGQEGQVDEIDAAASSHSMIMSSVLSASPQPPTKRFHLNNGGGHTGGDEAEDASSRTRNTFVNSYSYRSSSRHRRVMQAFNGGHDERRERGDAEIGRGGGERASRSKHRSTMCEGESFRHLQKFESSSRHHDRYNCYKQHCYTHLSKEFLSAHCLASRKSSRLGLSPPPLAIATASAQSTKTSPILSPIEPYSHAVRHTRTCTHLPPQFSFPVTNKNNNNHRSFSPSAVVNQNHHLKHQTNHTQDEVFCASFPPVAPHPSLPASPPAAHSSHSTASTIWSRKSSLKPVQSKVGTTWYRAPELYKDVGMYDYQADVYSFGVLCCEVMTEVSPDDVRRHNVPTFAVDLDSHAKDFPSDSPDGLFSLIKFCCEEDPDKRPTFHGILQHLQRLYFGMFKKESDDESRDETCNHGEENEKQSPQKKKENKEEALYIQENLPNARNGRVC